MKKYKILKFSDKVEDFKSFGGMGSENEKRNLSREEISKESSVTEQKKKLGYRDVK